MKTFTYEQALAYIHGTYGLGKKNGLVNMRKLLALLGNPECAYPSVHVAGTNGKGSVCAYLQAALRCAGLKTGLYTSPFLQRYNERMRIDGVAIPDETLAEIMADVASAVDLLRAEDIHPTEFEIGTALAFTYFTREQVDIAVIEVGLGGRLDPTNVIVPVVCGISSIGLDHMRVLGDTKEAIAREKAGIAKKGVPLVLSPQVDEAAGHVVRAHCEAVGAPLYLAGPPYEGELGLLGMYQRQNASVAVRMLDVLRQSGWSIPDAVVRDGLRRARWPGRLEWIQDTYPILLDGAHNPQGAESLLQYVRTLPRAHTTLLFGIMLDKDWSGVIGVLAKFADTVITVPVNSNRSLDPAHAAAAFEAHGIPAATCQSVQEGLARARDVAKRQNGRIVVAGSLYLIGELRTIVNGAECPLLAEK